MMIPKYLAWLVLLTGCFTVAANAEDPKQPQAQDLLLTHVDIYPSPTADPIRGGAIRIREGHIAKIMKSKPPKIDPNVIHIEGAGRSVTAGFWNSHVHFTPPLWMGLEQKSDAELVAQLRSVLTCFGFTSVVDTGSDPSQTLELRRRIESGVPGPSILMASGSFVGKDASPAYLDFKLPELETQEEAEAATLSALQLGVEGIKIFTGSFLGPGKTGHMTLPVVRSVTQTAHRRGVWVISHPQSLHGVELAAEGGVDILAHTAPGAGPWPEALIRQLVDRGVALIPTLQLWRFVLTRTGASPRAIDAFQQAGVDQLAAYVDAGGEVLFGTDVGFMTSFDPTEEYQKMGQAGMSFRQILEALTTAPAKRFGKGTGILAEGEVADLVVLSKDPNEDLSGFASVDVAIRSGRVIAECR